MFEPEREILAKLMDLADHKESNARIEAMLRRIIDNQEKAMTQQQSDVDAATAFDTQLDTDIQGLTQKVTAGTQALDEAIALFKQANPTVDTSKLVAAQLVLAGDQPNLDAAVAALEADPNITPTPVTPPVSS